MRARILRIGGDLDQSAARQTGHDAAHGRRLHLLCRSQFSKRLWAAENQHRQRRESRRAFSAGHILLANPAQQVDRRRVQPVGYL